MFLLHVIWMGVLGAVFSVAFSLIYPSSPAPEPGETSEPRVRLDMLAAYSPGANFQQRCEAELLPASVQVHWNPGRIEYDHSRSLVRLNHDGHAREGSLILGLTENLMGSNFSFGMSALTDPETGLTCMRPQVAVAVSAGVQRVSIPREFAPGSCAYQEVLDHELKHVRANDDEAAHTARRLEARIRKTLGNRVFYGTRAELEGHLDDAVREQWQLLTRESFATVEAEHSRVDREAENLRVMNSCQGEVMQIIRASAI